MADQDKNAASASGEEDAVKAESPAATAETSTASAAPKKEKSPAAPEKILPPGKQVAHRGGNGGLWFVVLLTLLLAGGSLGASYYLWQSDIRAGSEREQDFKLARQLKGQLDGLASSMGRLEQQAAGSESRLQQADKRISANNVRIEALTAMDRNDWVLAEVEFLLRLAIQRAVLAQDHKGAEKLLETADNRVRSLDDVSLLSLREAIAKDRASLKLASTLDRDGIYLKLAALATQLEQMPLVDLSTLQIKSPARFAAETAEPENLVEKVEHGFWAALDKLSAIIKIQYHEDPVGPLLPPDQQSYLRMNLRFMLEQAQLALLQQRQAVYADSLQKARVWIASYFVVEDEVKAALLSEIDTLIAVDVAQPLPDISGSLNQLHALLKVRDTSGGKK